MIAQIKILKDPEDEQMTATAVRDYYFTDAWLNLDSVSLVLPHKTLNMLCVWFNNDYAVTVTHEEWTRVAMLHGLYEWTDEEVAQMREDANDIKKMIDQVSPPPSVGYQFTAIIEDDGRTLESFPRGLAGQEVRVTVLGSPWKVGK